VERKRKKPLPSLRTIIELREQSEMDIRMTVIQQQQSGLNAMGSRLLLNFQTSKHMSSVPKQPTLNQWAPQKSLYNRPEEEEEDGII
jgi:calcium-dependent protein kinase